MSPPGLGDDNYSLTGRSIQEIFAKGLGISRMEKKKHAARVELVVPNQKIEKNLPQAGEFVQPPPAASVREKLKLAEREGFEPSERVLGAHTISNRADSTTLASLRPVATVGVDFTRWNLLKRALSRPLHGGSCQPSGRSLDSCPCRRP